MDADPLLSPDGRWRWDGVRWSPAARRQRAAQAERRLRSILHELRPAPVLRPATRTLVAAIVVIALLADAVMHSGGLGLGAELIVVALAGTLLVTGRLGTVSAKLLAASAPVLGAGTMIRASPWVTIPDLLAALGALGLAAALGAGPSFFDLSPAQAASRAIQGPLQLGRAPGFVGDALKGDLGSRPWSSRAAAFGVLRGAGLALPVVVGLALLLGSADVVFASVLRVDVDVPAGVGHAVTFLLAGLLTAALFRMASSGPAPAPPLPRWRLASVEALVVVGGLDMVFAAFCIIQVVAALGGADHVLQTQGLTFSEYARSGFFQLLGAGGLSLTTLILVRNLTTTSTPRVAHVLTVFMEAAVVFTIVVVAVALRRLQLYDDAFGLTMLRVYAGAAAAGIGVLFVCLGAAIAGLWPTRHWLLGAGCCVIAAFLLALTALNPEAVVARGNLERARAGAPLDTQYLLGLSDDAVPALVEAYASSGPLDRTAVRQTLCATGPDTRSWLALTLSTSAAQDAIHRIC